MFVNFWILWSLLGLGVATALFAWSVKTRQFENSRRASMLPFDDIKPESKDDKPAEKNRLLFWTVILLMLLSLGLLVGTIMMTF